MAEKRKVFALTICAYRKAGMDEEAYHTYMSEVHAKSVNGLMVKHGIVAYSMQHNTTKDRQMMKQIFGQLYEKVEAPYDCIVQIAFNSPEDFIRVKNDPHYTQVIMPDHVNFADIERTTMVTGWLETHIVNGIIL